MTHDQAPTLVLAIYPASRSFAFVLFEGPASPFDWGLKRIEGSHKNAKILAAIRKLIDRHRPEVLVIEETAARGQRRTARIRRLYRMLLHLAATEYVDVVRCSTTDVQACFASVGARSKYEIAKAIATQLPGFAHRVPPPRRTWMDRDQRQALFDAAALGLTYFARRVPSPYAEDVAA